MTDSRDPKSPAPSFDLDRRSFLRYVGTGASVLAGAHLGLFPLGCAGGRQVGWVKRDGSPDWVAPPYPVPLPGDATDMPDATRLATYEVRDDLVHTYDLEDDFARREIDGFLATLGNLGLADVRSA